jgi:hypothetical protein
MTKAVRIENADNGRERVQVEIFEKDGRGPGQDDLIDTIFLDFPTAMTDSRVYVTSTRYLVVKEIR